MTLLKGLGAIRCASGRLRQGQGVRRPCPGRLRRCQGGCGHPYGVGLLARAGRRRARLLGFCGLGFSGFGALGFFGVVGFFVGVRAGLWVSLLSFGFVVICISCHSVVLWFRSVRAVGLVPLGRPGYSWSWAQVQACCATYRIRGPGLLHPLERGLGRACARADAGGGGRKKNRVRTRREHGEKR